MEREAWWATHIDTYMKNTLNNCMWEFFKILLRYILNIHKVYKSIYVINNY